MCTLVQTRLRGWDEIAMRWEIEFLMRRIGLQDCPYCGEGEIHTSQPKTWRDEVCCFFFLQVVRCHSCMRRHYRPLFFPAAPTPVTNKAAEIATNDEQHRRSA